MARSMSQNAPMPGASMTRSTKIATEENVGGQRAMVTNPVY